MTGILISTFLLLIVALRDLLVLGVPTMTMYYFPSYIAVSIISLGDFFTRIEVLIGIIFVFCGFVKTCVCMFSATIGISKLINTESYKNLAVPVGLLMMTLASIIYSNTAEMFAWLNTYKYYALPFQVILPLIILVGAEIKTRLRKLVSSNQ
jgi:spore germination protein KB